MTSQYKLDEHFEKNPGLQRSAMKFLDRSLKTHSHLQELGSPISKSFSNIKRSMSMWMNYSLGLMGLSILILGAAYISCALIFYFLFP